MQAAAIASALVERENAHIYRMRVRDWLNCIEDPNSRDFEDMDEGRVFAEFLTNLVRVGSGLKAVDHRGGKVWQAPLYRSSAVREARRTRTHR
jgi:hypothetical protein